MGLIAGEGRRLIRRLFRRRFTRYPFPPWKEGYTAGWNEGWRAGEKVGRQLGFIEAEASVRDWLELDGKD